MPRTCTICRHPRRFEIDRALLAGAPLRDIAQRYAVTKDALHRHRTAHAPEVLRLAQLRECVRVARLWVDETDPERRRSGLLHMGTGAGSPLPRFPARA